MVEETICLLAAKLGLGRFFWNSVEDALDYKLEPIGHTWKSFVDRYYISNRLEYLKYRNKGFKTKNGKFNIYNEMLKKMGYSPLPQYIPVDDIGCGGSSRTHILSSGHVASFFNSEFRNIPSLRKLEKLPYIYIHPDSAKEYGIQDGEWIVVYNDKNDGVRFLVKISDIIDPRVVYIVASWWYPELDFPENWTKSNVNMITTEEFADIYTGASNLRGITCKLRKSEPV